MEFRSDRIKLFIFLFCTLLLITTAVVWLNGGFRSVPEEVAETPPAAEQSEPAVVEKEPASDLVSGAGSATERKERVEVKAILPQSEQQETKEIAQKFAEAYYTYDSKNPESYIENSKPYMAEAFYTSEKTKIRRQTLDYQTTSVAESEVLPVDSYDSAEIVWCVMITGDVIPAKGEAFTEEQQYYVTLRKYEGEWLVDELELESWGA
ncbi:hypothetical protein B9G55_23840 [Saccharibacillus sp. O16]|nr:hypothetical protein B9G55_23840 [Saccharibacillus sp. O16]